MHNLLGSVFATAGSALKSRRDLAMENLALRQQLAVLKRERRRPRLTDRDRRFWVWLSKLWTDWAEALLIVKPETLIRWHRKGFKRYWTQKSKRRGPGRPKIDQLPLIVEGHLADRTVVVGGEAKPMPAPVRIESAA